MLRAPCTCSRGDPWQGWFGGGDDLWRGLQPVKRRVLSTVEEPKENWSKEHGRENEMPRIAQCQDLHIVVKACPSTGPALLPVCCPIPMRGSPHVPGSCRSAGTLQHGRAGSMGLQTPPDVIPGRSRAWEKKSCRES